MSSRVKGGPSSMKSGSHRRPGGRGDRRMRAPVCRSTTSCCRWCRWCPATTVPFMSEPVRMSCWLGVSPRPFTGAPFSVRLFSFPSLLLSLWRSSTFSATMTPCWLYQGPRADAVLRVHGRLSAGGLGAEVGAPGLAAHARRVGELLAARVGAGESAEVSAVTRAGRGDEEAHGVLRAEWGRA